MALPFNQSHPVVDNAPTGPSTPAPNETGHDSQQTGPYEPAGDYRAPIVSGYEVLKELGRGGMGVVYLARHLTLKRLVALKLIRSGSSAGPAEMARFRAEAEAAARLQHANIVQIYEVGEADGLPYFALEFLPGGNLAGRLAEAPIQPAGSAAIVETLAWAVQYAHEQKVLHRDLKPANILLASDGSPKISDFGLAKLLGSEDVGLTQTGAVLGSPPYMSPEQASGQLQLLGPATDVYALGAILYECLTGRAPFRGISVADTLTQVREREPIAPHTLQPLVPKDLETICLKCLQKDPRRRYPSASELAEDLARYQAGRPILARPVSTWEQMAKWVHRRPTVAALSLTVLLVFFAGAGTAGWQWRAAVRAAARESDRADRERTARQEADRQTIRLMFSRATADGERGKAGEAVLRLSEALEKVASTDLEPADAEAFDRTIRQALGGWRADLHAQTGAWLHDSWVTAVAFAAGQRTFATGCQDGTVQIFNADGSLRYRSEPVPHSVRQLLFSPNGASLLVVRGQEATLEGPGRPAKRIRLFHHNGIAGVDWSPNGLQLLTAGEDGLAGIWSAATGEADGKPMKHPKAVLCGQFSPDGKFVLTGCKDGKAQIWNLAEREITQTVAHGSEVEAVAFAAKGAEFVTADSDGWVKRWALADGREIGSYKLDNAPLDLLKFSEEGAYLLAGGRDGTVHLRESISGQPIGSAFPCRPAVMAGAISQDGQEILIGGGDRVARRFECRNENILGKPLGYQGRIFAIGHEPNGTSVVIDAFERVPIRLDPETGKELGKRPVHVPKLRHPLVPEAAAVSADGRFVLIGCAAPQPPIEPPGPGGFPLGPPLPPGLPPGSVPPPGFPGPFIPPPRGEACLWTIDGQMIGSPIAHDNPVLRVAISADARWIATGTVLGVVQVWDAATHNPIGPSIQYMGGSTSGLAFDKTGSRLLSSGFGRVAHLRAIGATDDSDILRVTHPSEVVSVAISPDGTIIAIGSLDGTARLWSVESGQPLGSPLPHRGSVRQLSFDTTGRLLLTGAADGSLRLWDVRNSQPVGPWRKHRGPIAAVGFDRNGRFLAGALRDNRIWSIPKPVRLEVHQIRLWAEALTGMELAGGDAVRVLDEGEWNLKSAELGRLVRVRND